MKDEPVAEVKSGAIMYECIRCGTKVSSEDLASLPEIKCICGYRVFKKARPPVVKQLKSY
ncbi:MAG: RNA polymerase Rbp10 [Conexivisphaerales archaeon]|jgi:DNA-directed RNA polymerase subunit P